MLIVDSIVKKITAEAVIFSLTKISRLLLVLHLRLQLLNQLKSK
jgi:hypothetical protein